MRNIECCENRMREMVASDKHEGVSKLNKVLKAELLYLLKNYLDITAEDLKVEVLYNKIHGYTISMEVKARAIKIAYVFSR